MADTQIAFRSSAEVRDGLRQLARRRGRSMQAVLDDLCRRALASDGETPSLAGVIRRLRQHEGELERLGIEQLYVYGSVARGEARPWSDVDLFADLADEARWNIVRWGHVLDRLEEILARRVDFAARRSLPEDMRRRAEAEIRSGVRVRREDELLADIVRHGRLILDLIRGLDEAAFVENFDDGINPFAAAISYALVTIGEACRQLVGGGDEASGPPPAPIVAAHPEIDWRGWVGLRNVLTYGYHRRDPAVIWRATGELTALVQACEARQ